MPATTPIYSLPYPLATDPVAEGAQQIQALAEALELALADAEVPPASTPAAPASCRMVRTSTQLIANASDVIVTWQSASAGAGGWDSRPAGNPQFSAAGFTCRRAGIYALSACWPWAANGNGRRNMKILKNGTSATNNSIAGDATPATSWENILRVDDQIALDAGDVLRMAVAQDSGASLAGGKGASSSPNIVASMSLTWLRDLPA